MAGQPIELRCTHRPPTRCSTAGSIRPMQAATRRTTGLTFRTWNRIVALVESGERRTTDV
jgi:hypothetical protein